MKVRICDVCRLKNNKINLSVTRSGYKLKTEFRTESFYMDLCEEHKDFVKQYKDINELENAYNEMVDSYNEGGE